MLRAFYKSKKVGPVGLWWRCFIDNTSLWVQVQITVAINTWYGGFYNLLQTAAEYKDKQAEGIAIVL